MEDGTVVDSDWPLVDGEQSNGLLRELLSWHDDTNATSLPAEKGNDSNPALHFKVIGRVGMLKSSHYLTFRILCQIETCTSATESQATSRIIASGSL